MRGVVVSSKRRVHLTKFQKVSLWAVAIFVTYNILVSDTVSNALLSFFFGGQVPGTDIILPPEVMLWGVFGLFVCVLIVIVAELWRASNRRLREFGLGDSGVQQPSVASPVVVGAAATPRPPRAASSPLRMKAMAALKPLAEKARPYAHKAVVYTIGAYELGRIQCIKWAKKARVQLVRLWQWAKPYLWKLDTWLELKWLQLSAWAVAFARRQGFMQPAKSVVEPVVEEVAVPTPAVKKPRSSKSKTKPRTGTKKQNKTTKTTKTTKTKRATKKTTTT